MWFFINQNKYKVFLDIIKEFMRVFNTNQKKVLPPKKEGVKKKIKIAHVQLFFFPFLPTSEEPRFEYHSTVIW